VNAAQARLIADGFISPIVGHVGDGNFHCLLLVDDQDEDEKARAAEFVSWLNRLAISMDGTCTGEHGIGQGKMAYLEEELGAASVAVMVAIKTALDPDGIMNPGKIIAT
jgi:D-lactate dehydrogenase (cytochrome)